MSVSMIAAKSDHTRFVQVLNRLFLRSVRHAHERWRMGSRARSARYTTSAALPGASCMSADYSTGVAYSLSASPTTRATSFLTFQRLRLPIARYS